MSTILEIGHIRTMPLGHSSNAILFNCTYKMVIGIEISKKYPQCVFKNRYNANEYIKINLDENTS